MTSKLQMVITFATVVRLRPTIYQNAQNSEKNLDKGIWCMVLLPKSSSNCLISCSKIKHPLSLFFFKISATFFLTQSVKDTRNKNKNLTRTTTRTQITKQECNKTQTRTKQDVNKNATRTQITEQGQKHEPGKITKRNI